MISKKTTLLCLGYSSFMCAAQSKTIAQQIVRALLNSRETRQAFAPICRTKDPRLIQFLIEDRAKDFGTERADPKFCCFYWRQAYIANALDKLINGTPLLDIICVGKEGPVTTRHKSIITTKKGNQSTIDTMKEEVRFLKHGSHYSNEDIHTYFISSVRDYKGLQEEIDKKWEAVFKDLEE